ncbi:hypothetical protein [Glutamicibacter uratoxydans]|uniref:hypothetical protein n=1 Tax=Glutamicibacter uratoxydans TaxID=43667 RepID=UPI00114366F4|nr:hypothetical protein [Glutamicibacter uratoxydans]
MPTTECASPQHFSHRYGHVLMHSFVVAAVVIPAAYLVFIVLVTAGFRFHHRFPEAARASLGLLHDVDTAPSELIDACSRSERMQKFQVATDHPAATKLLSLPQALEQLVAD